MSLKKKKILTTNNSFEAANKGIRTTILGIITSILLAAIKAIAGIMGNSYALVADAIESASDVFTSIIVLAGLRIAQLPPDQKHPYGHGKAEPFAGIVVAIALFVAAIIIITQSIHEIITPHHAPAPFTLIVLVVVVLTKELLFRYIIKVGTDVNSVAVKNDAWHHRSDAITSGAAFIGISIALIGGEGYEQADDFAALFASGVIIFNAYRLLRPALDEIMDAAPSKEINQEIINATNSVDGVIATDKCYVRKMGLDYFIDIHIIVDGNLTVHDGHEIAHNVKDYLKSTFPQISNVLVHVEPATEERLSREHIIEQTKNKSS
ncbi:MAG: cation transporter [Ignavibacterium sp.]|jgi:cation diffusion facilitator family transporter|uniref:cation diffusion facilitator family transporter n=1 Tax=Ignavibacterium sp. TaxID=2651167 RepID=UPI0032999AC4